MWDSRAEDIISKGSELGVTNMFAVLTRLKQICNFDPRSGHSAKLDVLRTLLDTIQSSAGKVLIFSQFVETLIWLSDRIQVPHDVLHGGLPLEARDRMVTQFQLDPGPKALLVSLKAGGVGLNLQEASTVVLFDRWWNPASEAQAIQRAHRFGKKTTLEVIRFLVEDSIEERIIDILQTKGELFDRYIDDAPSGESNGMSKEELRHILQV